VNEVSTRGGVGAVGSLGGENVARGELCSEGACCCGLRTALHDDTQRGPRRASQCPSPARRKETIKMRPKASHGAAHARRILHISWLAGRPTRRDGRQPHLSVSLPHSHSIISERSKLLMLNGLAAASQNFTVIFTVNPSGTRIGAAFRPVRPKLTPRDLSTSIRTQDDCRHRRPASVSVRDMPKKRRHRTP